MKEILSESIAAAIGGPAYLGSAMEQYARDAAPLAVAHVMRHVLSQALEKRLLPKLASGKNLTAEQAQRLSRRNQKLGRLHQYSRVTVANL